MQERGKALDSERKGSGMTQSTRLIDDFTRLVPAPPPRPSRARAEYEWTHCQKLTLVQMWGDGATFDEIAHAIGKTAQACRSMWAQKGWDWFEWYTEQNP